MPTGAGDPVMWKNDEWGSCAGRRHIGNLLLVGVLPKRDASGIFTVGNRWQEILRRSRPTLDSSTCLEGPGSSQLYPQRQSTTIRTGQAQQRVRAYLNPTCKLSANLNLALINRVRACMYNLERGSIKMLRL